MKKLLWAIPATAATLEERAGVAVSMYGTSAGPAGTPLVTYSSPWPALGIVIVLAVIALILLYMNLTGKEIPLVEPRKESSHDRSLTYYSQFQQDN